MTGTSQDGVAEPPGQPDTAADGPLVWHYTDGPGLLAILSGHTLWATAAPFLNDRDEVALGGRMVIDRLLARAAQQEGGVAELLAEQVRTASARGEGPGTGSAFILSASSSPDSLAMWRLYGRARESYAVGLDPAVPLRALSRDGWDLPPAGEDGVDLRHHGWQGVRYRREEQLALVDAAIDLLDDLAGGPAAESFAARRPGDEPAELSPRLRSHLARHLEPFLDAMQQALLLVKHEAFADEREWRYAAMLLTRPGPGGDRAEASLLSFRSTAYGIAPYLRLTGPDPDRPQARVAGGPARLPVRAVAVSPSPNGPEATASVRRMVRAHGYDVPVLRSAIPFRS